jgi:alpha-mannosidase
VGDEEVEPGEPHHGYTDQCDHLFTYALYPHPGDHLQGNVIRAGYELNVPLRVTPAEAHAGAEPREASFLCVDTPNVIVEAVKKAEDADAVIVRLYECEHRNARATVRFGFPVRSAAEVNLMEEDARPLDVTDDCVNLTLSPFEIGTLEVTPA